MHVCMYVPAETNHHRAPVQEGMYVCKKNMYACDVNTYMYARVYVCTCRDQPS